MEDKVKELNQLINDYIVKNELEYNNIFQNIWLFYNMTNALNDLLKDFSDISDVKNAVQNSKRFDFFEKIALVKDFYSQYNINLDLDTLIIDGTIEFIESDIDENPFYYNGRNSKINGHKSVKVSNNGTIADVPIFVHELGHFRNQLDKTTSMRELFTEPLARTDELLFLDYLKNFGYEEEVRKLTIYIFQYSAYNARYAKPVLKMFLLFDELGDISIDSYKMLYEDTTNYEQELKVFEGQIKREEFYLDEYVRYVFDTYISSYLYLKYRENNKFLENINKLHEMVKTNNMFEILKSIGLTNLGKEDQDILLNAVKEMINSITKEENVTRTK